MQSDNGFLPNISKRRGTNDSVYVAGLNGKRVGLYAHSLAAAKQKAIEHFRPKKRELGLLWVEFVKE